MQAETPQQKALVTGAAGGIGKAIARRLASGGAKVVISDLREDVGTAVADQLRAEGAEAWFVHADLTDEAGIAAMAEQAADAMGGLDVLVNNARPRISRTPFPDNLVDWDFALDVLLKAPALAVKYALPMLKQSSQAAVVNISSVASRVVSPQPAAYHVAKAGLEQLTRYLAQTLGADGITVNAVCPGLVDIPDENRVQSRDATNAAAIDATVPLGRAGTDAEVADVTAFLCSPAARYISGQILVVDGGTLTNDPYHVAQRAIVAART